MALVSGARAGPEAGWRCCSICESRSAGAHSGGAGSGAGIAALGKLDVLNWVYGAVLVSNRAVCVILGQCVRLLHIRSQGPCRLQDLLPFAQRPLRTLTAARAASHLLAVLTRTMTRAEYGQPRQ